MNAYLELTKYRGSNPTSDLSTIVTAAAGKIEFYESLINKFQNRWQQIAKGWYQERYDFYGVQVQPDEHKRKSILIKCNVPVIIGQGTHSVLETHLTMHSIYGMPYLPGSSIKGITAHYCHQVLGKEEEKFSQGGEYAKILFGTAKKKGIIHFHDAWPVPESVARCLRLDVMTPHHQAYYQGLDQAPRDDDSPIPIPFLAATGKFRLLLSCDDSDGVEWLQLAEKIVGYAINEWGVGGKTNAGYGKMEVVASE